jgi:hypothetical protein
MALAGEDGSGVIGGLMATDPDGQARRVAATDPFVDGIRAFSRDKLAELVSVVPK